MASRRILNATLVSAAAALTACGSSSETSGPNTNTGPSAFAPSRDTTLAGTVQFTTFNIPAGVTVTASGPLTIKASGNVQIAGTLAAPCLALSVLGAKKVTITGTVSTTCAAALPTPAPTLLILGDSGYTLQGAKIVASGPLNITTDTTLTDAGFPQSTTVDLSASHARKASASAAAAASQAAGGICAVPSATFIADPASAPNGADGTPVGQNGQDGSPWALSCTGEMDLQGVVSVTGQNGGNGGKGTSTTSATAVGGNGGKGGTLRVRAAGDLVISGGATFTSGSGGNGGAANATPSAQGTPATASGGKGGDVTGASGQNGPVDIRAKGSITIQSATTIVVGSGGGGGAATASGVDGAAGQPGSAGTAAGGNGGNTSPYGLAGSNVSGIASVHVQGGNGGAGGASTASAGNGGAPGGPGGPNSAIGGTGGNAQVKDQNGNLVGSGGDGGGISINKANGAAGANACPNAGQAGGAGGSATGRPGKGGTGQTAGKDASTVLNNTGNGANGGDGNTPGHGGPGGSDGTTGVKIANGVNFQPGKDGNPCPAPASTLTLVNGDLTNQPWDSVRFSVNNGPLNKAAQSGNNYTIDLTGVAGTSFVRLLVASTVGTRKHLYFIDAPAAWLLALANDPNCAPASQSVGPNAARIAGPTPTKICLQGFYDEWGGTQTGTVKFTENGLTNPARVLIDNNVVTTNATLPGGSAHVPLGHPIGISQVIGPIGGAATAVSGITPSLTDNQDFSALLTPTFPPQLSPVTIPAGSIGGPAFTAHGLDAIDYRIHPRFSLLDSWRFYDAFVFSKQNATPTTFTMPTISGTNMPSTGLQWLGTTMFMTPTTWLGEFAYGTSFASHAVTFASAYIPPTINTQTGPSGTTFTVNGQFAPGYIAGEWHSSAAVNSTTYIIDAHYYLGASGSFSIQYGPIPSGGIGAYQYEAKTNDPSLLPTEGAIYWRAGYMGSFGTPTQQQALSVTGPSASVTVPHGGGCASVNIIVTTTALTQDTFLASTQTAGAAGVVTASPANSVVSPGTGTGPITHSVPVSICSSSTSTGGATAILQFYAASIGTAQLLEGNANVTIVIN